MIELHDKKEFKVGKAYVGSQSHAIIHPSGKVTEAEAGENDSHYVGYLFCARTWMDVM